MQNTNLQLVDRLRTCLERVKPLRIALSDDLWLRGDLGFDSLDLIDLLFECEKEFSKPLLLRDLSIYLSDELKRSSNDLTFAEFQCFILRWINSK